jgi:hypothetical protein
MNVTDGYVASNFSANQGPFKLKGGRYVLTASATWSAGSIALQYLGPDGVTWIPALTVSGSANTLSANGQQVMDLAAGQYRIAVTGSPSAVYAAISLVPV